MEHTSAFTSIIEKEGFTPASVACLQDAIHTVQPTIPISRIHFLFNVIILFLIVFLLKLVAKVGERNNAIMTNYTPKMFLFRHSSFLRLMNCL